MIGNLLQIIFFALFVRPVVFLMLGLNVRNKQRLPKVGPAIIAANHNSHLDTLVLMSLFPLVRLKEIKPVAAADYFLKNKRIAWFATNIIGIIPISRKPSSKDANPLQACVDALDDRKILIVFPEGSRGVPEEMQEFKTGITHILKERPDVLTTPVFLHGLGKSLPKDAYIPVPLFCDVLIGEPIQWNEDREEFMSKFSESIRLLSTR